MMKRLFSFIVRDASSLGDAALLLSFFALLSQFLGLIRDRALAHTVGVGRTLDIYTAAFRIPDFLYISLVALISTAVLVPFIIERLNQENGEEKVKKLVNSVFTVFSVTILCVSVALFFLMPAIVRLSAPGFNSEELHTLATLSRIMLLSPFFLGLSNFYGAVIQSKRLFFSYAIAPVLYNVGILVGIFVFYPYIGITGLAFGVITGALLHFVVQIPSLHKAGIIPHFSTSIDWSVVKKVGRISFPRTFTMALASLTVLVLYAFATKFEVGSVSLFYFALNIATVPLSVVGTSFAAAAFPLLVELFQKDNKIGFSDKTVATVSQIIFWVLPLSVLLIVLRAHVVRVLLGTNIFSWNDTKITAALLLVLSLCALPQCLSPFFIRSFYARGDTRTPFFTVLLGACSTVFIAYIVSLYPESLPFKEWMINILRLDSATSIHVIGLACAYSIGHYITLSLLYFSYKKTTGFAVFPKIRKSFFEILAASLLLGGVTYLFLRIFNPLFDQRYFVGVLGQAFFSGILGIISFMCLLSLFKNKEYVYVINSFKKKFWKTPVIIPEQDAI